jgi:hypothetical protein
MKLDIPIFNQECSFLLGSNLTKLAIPLLQDLVNKRQTTLSDEEKRVIAARKLASTLKAKATRSKNKAKALSKRSALPESDTESSETETSETETSAYFVQSPSNTASVSLVSSSSLHNGNDTTKNLKTKGISVVIDPTSKDKLSGKDCINLNFNDNELFLRSIKPTEIYVWIYNFSR